MADSDQAIRDIVAQLNGAPAAPAPAPDAMGSMMTPAPEVTPAMSVMLPQSVPVATAAPSAGPSAPMAILPAGAFNPGPGAPMDITPKLPVARAKADDWTMPAVAMTPPPVQFYPTAPTAPMGAMARVR